MSQKLKKDFYKRDVITVAKELLGKIFVFENPKLQVPLKGKIVEVEAYDGKIDEAAHSFKGPTNRNKIMFDEGGLLYVYFIYGMYFCANIVTGEKDYGQAVLIRAMEPINNLEIFGGNRFNKKKLTNREKVNLLNGPGKICNAFKIDKSHNGVDLTKNSIYLLNQPNISEQKIVISKRIGIKKSADLPWRFYIKNCEFISKR